MKKIDKEELIQRILIVSNAAKEELGSDMGVTVIDYMVIAALEKLGLTAKKIKKIYMEG